MTKAGDKLLSAAREALAVARGDPDAISKIKVTPSCGCVFCDMGLEPDELGQHRIVKTAEGGANVTWVECRKVKP